jgi:hypothetical protein
MAFQKGHKKFGGRKRGSIRALDHPDGLVRLVAMMESEDPLITPELKLRAAIAVASFQHCKPTAPRAETFITRPIDYKAPETVEEARGTILTLGERLARAEISIEAHDALVNGLKAFLGDRAAEQERLLAQLQEDLGHNGRAHDLRQPGSPHQA